MNYRVLFFTITLSIFLMGSVLFYVVSQGAKHAQDEVLSDQQDRSLTSPTVTKALFSLGEPAYRDPFRECGVPYLDLSYVNVVMEYHSVPQSCALFVNDRLVSIEKDLTPDCRFECPYGEFSRTFSLDFHDIRDAHVVRVCCNDICLEDVLEPLCS